MSRQEIPPNGNSEEAILVGIVRHNTEGWVKEYDDGTLEKFYQDKELIGRRISNLDRPLALPPERRRILGKIMAGLVAAELALAGYAYHEKKEPVEAFDMWARVQFSAFFDGIDAITNVFDSHEN